MTNTSQLETTITLTIAAGRPQQCCTTVEPCNAVAVTAIRTQEVLPVPVCERHR